MRKAKANLLIYFFILLIFNSCKDDPSPVENEIVLPSIELNQEEKALVDELNKYISPINGFAPSTNNSDLEVLDKFAGTKVIGLGEATHGTKEFFQMKHRIFKYFVEKHGYKIFAFEADMGECIYIDRFITQGIGSINEVMKKMHFWTWRTEEVKDLILWMAQYNMGKSEANKIHFLGVDCQYVTYNKELIEEYLKKYDNQYPAFISSILTEVGSITYEKGASLEYNYRESLYRKYDSVYTYFLNMKSKLVSKSGEFEYNIISQLVKQGKQRLEVISNTTYGYRDLYMAQNTEWLSNLFGASTKIVAWAHNGHVGKNSLYSYSGSQGYHLKTSLNEDYKVIGFSFNMGSFQAINYDVNTKKYTGLIIHDIKILPPRESSNYIFYAANPKNFILVNSVIPTTNKLFSWLNTNRNFQSIGAVYYIAGFTNYFYSHNLFTTFDAIIHIQSTTAAIPFI